MIKRSPFSRLRLVLSARIKTRLEFGLGPISPLAEFLCAMKSAYALAIPGRVTTYPGSCSMGRA